MGTPVTIVIPAPVGLPCDAVEVLNYKMRPACWEEGVLQACYFSPAYQGRLFSGEPYEVPAFWRYEVFVDRPRAEDRYGRVRGGGYVLTVRGEGARAVAS